MHLLAPMHNCGKIVNCTVFIHQLLQLYSKGEGDKEKVMIIEPIWSMILFALTLDQNKKLQQWEF